MSCVELSQAKPSNMHADAVNPRKRRLPSPSDADDAVRFIKKMKHSKGRIPKKLVKEILLNLQAMGVRLLEECEVRAMRDSVCVRLGSGSFGSCYKTVDPDTQQEVVVKTFFDDRVDDLLHEVVCLQRLQQAGVQRVMGVCMDTNQLLTYYAGKEADHYFEKCGVSYGDKLSVFLQLAHTLEGVVNKGFTHNDLKIDNVCVSVGSSGLIATVIDFGVATSLHTERICKKKIRPEEHPWVAPELQLHTHPTSEASEVYSLADTMWEEREWLVTEFDHPLVRVLKSQMDSARSYNPADRPHLADLVVVLQALHDKTLQAHSSRTEECGVRWTYPPHINCWIKTVKKWSCNGKPPQWIAKKLFESMEKMRCEQMDEYPKEQSY